jgi:hypothetical protein
MSGSVVNLIIEPYKKILSYFLQLLAYSFLEYEMAQKIVLSRRLTQK